MRNEHGRNQGNDAGTVENPAIVQDTIQARTIGQDDANPYVGWLIKGLGGIVNLLDMATSQATGIYPGQKIALNELVMKLNGIMGRVNS